MHSKVSRGANTSLSWGTQLRDARLTAEARSRYRRAVE